MLVEVSPESKLSVSAIEPYSMSFSFEIKESDLEAISDFVKTLEERASLSTDEAKEALKEVFQVVMFEDLRKRFASSPSAITGGEVYGGETWGSLSEWYLSKNPERVGGQIYIDTHALQSSLVGMTSNTISEFEGDNTYQFGSRLKYAEKLQEMRPIVFMHPQLARELVEAYEKFLQGSLNKKEKKQ